MENILTKDVAHGRATRGEASAQQRKLMPNEQEEQFNDQFF